MISVRSRLSIRTAGQDALKIQISLWRRLFYFAIGAVLLSGFFAGGEPLFAAGLTFGTVFYLTMVAVSLGVAGWNAVTTIDRRRGTIAVARRFFGVPLRTRQIRFPDLEEFLIRRIVLFRGFRGGRNQEYGRVGMIQSGRDGLSPRRKELGKLYLVVKDGPPQFLEESTDLSELWVLAERMGEFVGVRVRSEDL